MKKTQRLISLLLTVVMLISLFDIVIYDISTSDDGVAYAANKFGQGTYNGGTISLATGDGTWSNSRTGVRIYCVDPDGKLLTKVMDLINPSYFREDMLYMICHGTRTETDPQYVMRTVPKNLSPYFITGGATATVDGDFPIVSTDQIIKADSSYPGTHTVKHQITDEPATFKEESVTLDVMKIVPSGGITKVNNYGKKLGKYMTGQNEWKPQLSTMDGAAGGAEPDNSEEPEIPDTVYEQLNTLKTTLDTNYSIYKQQFDAGQISASQLIDEIGRDGLQFVESIKQSNQYSDQIIALFALEVKNALDGYKSELSEHLKEGTSNNEDSRKLDEKSNENLIDKSARLVTVSDGSGNTYTLKSDNSHSYNSYKVDISSNKNYYTNDKYTTIFDAKLANSLFDLAFAADDKEKSKPIWADEQFTNLFLTQWWGTNPMEFLPHVQVIEYPDGTIDPIATLCNYKGILMMEPIFFSRLNHTDVKTASDFVFYGTPYNLGLVMQEQKRIGGFSDGNGKGGNIGRYTNQNLPWIMYTEVDLEVGGFTIEAGSKHSVGTRLTNDQLADRTIGHSLHWYKFSSSAEPQIPTYDFYSKDPNPEPHPAPDPDPKNGPIPLIPGENPLKSRTVNIVKTYQIEHIDGTIEHIETTARRHTPKTILILNEPAYKAVEWFTSPTYYFEPEGGDVDSALDDMINQSSEEYFKETIDPNPAIPDTEWDTMKNGVLNTDGALKTYEESATVPVKENVFPPSVKISDACKCAEKCSLDGEHGKHYHDTTLYVRLIKKEIIPETSTYDEPDHKPTTGQQPYVDPHPSEEPKNPPNPNVNDPETTPVVKGDPFVHYRIVKVYETYTEDDEIPENERWSTDYIGVTYETNPIVYIQDEGQTPAPGKQDMSWHLTAWQSSEYFQGVSKNDTSAGNTLGNSWETIIAQDASGQAIESGTAEAKVDLRTEKKGDDDPEDVITLYVRLVRKLKVPDVDAAIIIQQSQISKTIHTNDGNIGGMFGNYRFATTIGSFEPTHTSYYHENVCCQKRYETRTDSDGNSYTVCVHDCGHCHGHTCKMNMPGNWGDDKVKFVFDQYTGQDVLEVKTGVNPNTDPKVYGKGGASSTRGDGGINYPRTVNTLFAEDNKYYFNSDGKSGTGAEYVTVLWRGANGANNRSDPISPPPNDIPTLALFKKKDIEKRYGTDNYKIPYDMITKNGGTSDKVSKHKRMATNWLGDLEFSFGILPHGMEGSDLKATSSCSNIGNFKGGCVHPQTLEYYPIELTKHIWGDIKKTDDFYAGVAIRFYAGVAKAPQTAPLGSPGATSLEIPTGTHKENNIIQCKQFINFYPYIRMTYMVNSLDDAKNEEKNTDNTGYKKDVRKDTYVLSEYESSVLPADAVEIGWEGGNEDTSLTLISQQWSVHQKAIGGGAAWNGRNQVLPGGAIYQLATQKDNLRTIRATTYQTVVDDKARNEYLSNKVTEPEYTVHQVFQDHLDFMNDLKEVLDSLKVVQWVNKDFNAATAWTSDYEPDATHVKLINDNFGSITPPEAALNATDLSGLRGGAKTTPNTEEKYYMRPQKSVADYQGASDLTAWTQKQESDQNGFEGDFDVFNLKQTTKVYKLFTDTSGNVYLATVTNTAAGDALAGVEGFIDSAVRGMRDLNADTYAMGQTGGASIQMLCDKKISGAMINSVLSGDAKRIDDKTKFITNFVSALTRNKGKDLTAEWSNKPDGKWYNEAFDGIYLVEQAASLEVGFKFGESRVSALDPALCPQNKGQSDLYTNAFLSQFCTDSNSNAACAQGKKKNYIGTFKGADITLPDMEKLYQSKKFYIPNANVQDLN